MRRLNDIFAGVIFFSAADKTKFQYGHDDV